MHNHISCKIGNPGDDALSLYKFPLFIIIPPVMEHTCDAQELKKRKKCEKRAWSIKSSQGKTEESHQDLLNSIIKKEC